MICILFRHRKLPVRCGAACTGRRTADAVDRGLHPGKSVCSRATRPSGSCRLPMIGACQVCVREFLEKASFQTEYLYFVATYGTTPGATGYMAQKAIRGCQISAYYSVRMPDTWTPIFDLSTPEKVAKYTKTTETEIDGILSAVAARRTNRHMAGRTPAFLTEWIAQPLYDRQVRRTSHLRVEDSCISCGFARKNARYRTLRYTNGKPVWVKEKCVMCLGCLHRCPKFAIQYGKNTKKHGPYFHPKGKALIPRLKRVRSTGSRKH